MKGLIEKKNSLINKAEDVLNKAKLETRELTEDEAKELAEIKETVKRIEETLMLDDDFKKMDVVEEEKKEEVVEEERALETRTLERQQFENFLRGSLVHERAGELTPTPYNPSSPTAGAGGKLIPTTIVDYIIKKVYDICPILERSQKFNVKGTLEVPFYPADSNNINVAYQTEFSALSSSSGSFDTKTLTGFLAGALTKISRSLINNMEFNIVGFVVDEMAQAIARFIEGELLNGTTNKVEGLSGLSNLVTTASASAITADEVIKTHDAIKDRFQNNAIWIMNNATRTALRSLKSNTGYYLLNDDISSPFGTTLLGKPVYVSDNMSSIATGKNVIYYGDMSGLATKFSEDINIQVLREKFADEHADGVIGWFEFDSKVINEQMIAGLKMA